MKRRKRISASKPAVTIENNPEFIEPREAAKKLHTTAGTLAIWRCTRRYPLSYIKIGSKVLYRVSDIEKFIQSRTVVPITAEQ